MFSGLKSLFFGSSKYEDSKEETNEASNEVEQAHEAVPEFNETAKLDSNFGTKHNLNVDSAGLKEQEYELKTSEKTTNSINIEPDDGFDNEDTWELLDYVENETSVSDKCIETMAVVVPTSESNYEIQDCIEALDVNENLTENSGIYSAKINNTDNGEVELTNDLQNSKDSATLEEVKIDASVSKQTDDVWLPNGTEGKSKPKRLAQQVKPLSPERQPSWQLRKKRPNRKPLNSKSVTNNGNIHQQQQHSQALLSTGKYNNDKNIAKKGSIESQSLSPKRVSTQKLDTVRSSPDLVNADAFSMLSGQSYEFSDEFFNSVFRYKDNLDSSASSPLPDIYSGIGSARGVADANEEPLNRRLEGDNNYEKVLWAKDKFKSVPNKISTAYMDRMNKIATGSASHKREDRRAKMHSKLNGCSVDRKVHKKFN